MPPPCDLCAAIDPTGTGGPLHRHLRPGQQHIVARTRHAVAVPTIGAFVPGYLLVVPVTHTTSIGQLPQVERTAVEALTIELAARLARRYRLPVLGFEYGLNVRGGRRIEHSHQHLLPTPAGAALRHYLSWYLPIYQVDSMQQLPGDVDRSYISVFEPGRPLSVFPVANDASPRLRLREIVAQFDPRVPLGGGDWQRDPNRDLMRATIDAFTAADHDQRLIGAA